MDILESLLSDLDHAIEAGDDVTYSVAHLEGAIENLSRLGDPNRREILQALREIHPALTQRISNCQVHSPTPSRIYTGT